MKPWIPGAKKHGRYFNKFFFFTAFLFCYSALFSAEAELLLRDFEIKKVMKAPRGSRFFLVSETSGKTTFYMVSGSKIFVAEEGGNPMLLASVPGTICQLGRLPVKFGNKLFVLTEKGSVYIFSKLGEAIDISKGITIKLSHISFTSLPLYYMKPYAMGSELGRNFIYRLNIVSKGNNQSLQLSVDTKLELFNKNISSFNFVEKRGNWGLFALSERGILWRIDSQGFAYPSIKTPRLKDASSCVFDKFGLFEGSFILSILSKGQLWEITPEKKMILIAKKLDSFSQKSSNNKPGEKKDSYREMLSISEFGTLYLLVGGQILRIAPKKDSPLAQSAREIRKAEELFSGGEWQKSGEMARKSLKTCNSKPKYWSKRINELIMACLGQIKLEAAIKAAEIHGFESLLPTAKKLEYTYDKTRILPGLSLFRKRCEVAVRTIILADFEEENAKTPGFPDVLVKASPNSNIWLTSRPEPVKEGDYSLRWSIPRRRNLPTATLSVSSSMWGHCDDFSNISLWIYSPYSRVKMVFRVLNTTNAELAVYYIVLKRGWQRFIRPPFYLVREELPDNLTIKGFSIEVSPQFQCNLYLDDIRLITKGKKPQ